MSRIADSAGTNEFRGGSSALELRVFRAMIAVVIVAVVLALIVASSRVTMGLLIGGSLSLLNYHWLRTSMAVVFAASTFEVRPRIRLIRYILRYFVIATVVAVAYKVRMISFPATIAGLCSFVPAFLIEASRQSYFAFIGREESI